jgi:hypothetical protein
LASYMPTVEQCKSSIDRAVALYAWQQAHKAAAIGTAARGTQEVCTCDAAAAHLCYVVADVIHNRHVQVIRCAVELFGKGLAC